MTITVLDNMEYGSDAAARSTYGSYDPSISWLSGWNYRKSITLSRSSGAVTNYQMMLLVEESSGATGENVDCNSHCLSSFNDLRFTKSDGTTLLDYWIESISGTTPNQLATVWIEFDSIGTTDTVFFMYYGNSESSSISNGANTFLFFDDFDSDLSKWYANGTPSISNSAVTLSGTRGEYIRSIGTYGVNTAIRSKMYFSGAPSSNQSNMLQYGDWSSLNSNIRYIELSAVGLYAQSHNNSGSETVIGVAGMDRSYNIFNIRRNSTTNVTFYTDVGTITTISTNIGSLDRYVGFYNDTTDKAIYCDWFVVRQYLDAEPVWGTWGSEMAYGTPIVYSEPTSIVEGSYSLKAIAAQTTSLNKTLTRTITTPINLTGHAYIIGKIRASRTGSNIKIGFHDSGGTTTEVTPNITSADTWQTIQLDISSVSDANKDVIDQIIITVVNADADNTFYLDNFFAVDATDFAAGVQVSKAVGYAVLYPIANAMNVSKVVAYAVLGPYVEPQSGSGPMMWIF